MSLATDNYTTAQAALISQITALVNQAAAAGQYFVITQTLYDNQTAYLTANGYRIEVNILAGTFKIRWDPAT